MKRVAVVALVAMAGAMETYGQANNAGILYAAHFARWTVAQGGNGPLSWSDAHVCTSAVTGGVTIKPFAVGTPIRIVDTTSQAASENVMVTQVSANGAGCSVTVTPVTQHYSFYLASATAGLQEAINYANGQPYVVIITPDFTRLGGTTAMITAAQGSIAVGILDQRTALPVTYLWTAGAYVAQSASGFAGLTNDVTVPAGGTAATVTSVGGQTASAVALATAKVAAVSEALGAAVTCASGTVVQSTATGASTPCVTPPTTSVSTDSHLAATGSSSSVTLSLANITGYVSAGSNVTRTGSGTATDPYVLSSTAGGASAPATNSLYKGTGSANGIQAATPGTDYVIPSALASVATSGAYSDLSGAPVQTSVTAGTLLKAGGTNSNVLLSVYGSTGVSDQSVSSSGSNDGLANLLAGQCATGTTATLCDLLISPIYTGEYSHYLNAAYNGNEEQYQAFPFAGGMNKARFSEDRRGGMRAYTSLNPLPLETNQTANGRPSFVFEQRVSGQLNYADAFTNLNLHHYITGSTRNYGIVAANEKSNASGITMNSVYRGPLQGGGLFDTALRHLAPGDDMVFTVQHDTNGCSEGEDECNKLFRAFIKTGVGRWGGTLTAAPVVDSAGFGNYTIRTTTPSGYDPTAAGEAGWLVNLSRLYTTGNIATILSSSYPGLVQVTGDTASAWASRFGTSAMTTLTAGVDPKTYSGCPATVTNSSARTPDPLITDENGVGGLGGFCATVASTSGMTDGMSCTVAGQHSNFEQMKLVHVVDGTHVTGNFGEYHDAGEAFSCGGAQGYALSKTQDDLASIFNYPNQPTVTLHKFWPIVGSDSSGKLYVYIDSAKANEMPSLTYMANAPAVAATVSVTTGGGGVASVSVTNGGSVDYTAKPTGVVAGGQYALAAPGLTFTGCSVQPTYTATTTFTSNRWQPSWTITSPGTCSSPTATAQSVYPIPYRIAPLAVTKKTVDPATGATGSGYLLTGNLATVNWQSGDATEIVGHVHDSVASTRVFGKYFTGASVNFGTSDGTYYTGDWGGGDSLKGVINQTDGHKYYASASVPLGPGVAYETPPDAYRFSGDFKRIFPIEAPPSDAIIDVSCDWSGGGTKPYSPCDDNIPVGYNLFRPHSTSIETAVLRYNPNTAGHNILEWTQDVTVDGTILATNINALTSMTAPTRATGTNTTDVATTAFVAAAVAAGGPSLTPVITISASGTTQTLAFASSGDVAYDITLSANCTISIATPANTGTYRKITLVIRPAGFTATLPASSASIAYAGGSAPTPSTSAITVITFGSTGVAPILGGL